jgi:3-oxoacyl-[acyl-carrier-protein] synthase-3
MHGTIAGMEYYLPSNSVTTDDLAVAFPEWLSIKKVLSKTGVETRYMASLDECSSDLAVFAARRLFESTGCKPEDIDFVLSCTQTPDYQLPANACLIQDRLGIPTTAGALDFTLGCSGFVYGLGLAEGLITSGQARSVLLITAETVSKHLGNDDKASRAIFGDGASATWIRGEALESPVIGPFVYGTDGKGCKSLYLPNSGSRRLSTAPCLPDPLFMDGQKIINFAIETVPHCVNSLLVRAELTLDDIDLFVFHQANEYLLEELRRILAIPSEKFQITLSHCANTVSSTIPIALKHASLEGKLVSGNKAMLLGFGVGYSWAGTIVEWPSGLV